MNQSRVSGGIGRTTAVVMAATLLALALPAAGPLYAEVYPGLTPARLDAGFESEPVIQYEEVQFTATAIYGPDVGSDFDVFIAWSNVVTLEPEQKEAFDIRRTSPPKLLVEQASLRPDGNRELTWTWQVTPLLDGTKKLQVRVSPSATIKGQKKDAADLNKPISVWVEVHPAKRDFDEVVAAAEAMQTDIDEVMTVGEEYDVGASMSMAGHPDTVSVDLALTKGEDSVDVAITESTAARQAVAQSALSTGNMAQRRWTVVPLEAGRVDLLFTATVVGQAAGQPLTDEITLAAEARANDPPPSVWDRLQQPVLYVTPFIVLIGAIWALVEKGRRRRRADSRAVETSADAGAGYVPPSDPPP